MKFAVCRVQWSDRADRLASWTEDVDGRHKAGHGMERSVHANGQLWCIEKSRALCDSLQDANKTMKPGRE
jgi:hypothetical protein